MPYNTFYKKVITEEEREECFQWFEQRRERLPASLSMGAISLPDLPHAVDRMLTILRHQMKDNPTYSGQFAVLELIRSKLIEQGL